MNKNKLQQLQEKIILLNHPECETVQSAFRKEAVYGARIVYLNEEEDELHETDRGDVEGEEVIICNGNDIETHTLIRIIGLPITIGRIIKALDGLGIEDDFTFLHYRLYGEEIIISFENADYYERSTFNEICTWKLTKEGKELTLEDQDESTQKALYDLFCNG